MERAGHEGAVADRLAFGIAGDDGVHERACFVAGERLHGDAGWLVEGEERVIGEERAERAGGGRDAVIGGLEEFVHVDGLAAQCIRHVERLAAGHSNAIAEMADMIDDEALGHGKLERRDRSGCNKNDPSS